jgi:hypothetical protein
MTREATVNTVISESLSSPRGIQQHGAKALAVVVVLRVAAKSYERVKDMLEDAIHLGWH